MKARWDGQGFDCATWSHKARVPRKENFRLRAEALRKGEGPSELVCFEGMPAGDIADKATLLQSR